MSIAGVPEHFGTTFSRSARDAAGQVIGSGVVLVLGRCPGAAVIMRNQSYATSS
jgi:hypothetical protein